MPADITGVGPPLVMITPVEADDDGGSLTVRLADSFRVHRVAHPARPADPADPIVLEEFDAVLADAGGSALVFGVGAGAALALEAAAAGLPIIDLAVLEPPYRAKSAAPQPVDADVQIPAARLATIRVPTLVITRDPCPVDVRETAEAITGIVPTSRHIDVPAPDGRPPEDLLASLLLEWFC